MKIKITSRAKIEALALAPFAAKTALISVTDENADFAALKYKPDFLLQLRFDDITSEDAEYEFVRHMGRKPTKDEKCLLKPEFRLISDSQVEEIAEFVYQIKDEAALLICQCEHGQSRSAAIAAAVIEHFHHRGIIVFADDQYFPNKLIYRKVYAALNQRAKQEG